MAVAGGSTAWWTTTSQPYVAGRAGPRLEVTLAGLVLSTSDLCSGITCFLMFRAHMWGAILGGWMAPGAAGETRGPWLPRSDKCHFGRSVRSQGSGCDTVSHENARGL